MIPKTFNNSATRLTQAVRRYGMLRTLNIILLRKLAIVADILFDLKNGTDTRTVTELNDLYIISSNKKKGWKYESTPILALQKLFSMLIIPNNSIFVDFGCGKGKVLIIASEFGFKEVRGIDFSSELCKIAVNNCLKYKERVQNTIEYSVFESDVVDYQVRDDENVFYLFNPFDARILENVLNNIQLSLSRFPRKIWIIYSEPRYRSIIENSNTFKKENEFYYPEYIQYSICVYSNNIG